MTDQDVLDFMTPRPLNFKISHSIPRLQEPFLTKEALNDLDVHLLEHSYIHGYQLSEVDLEVACHCKLVQDYPNVSRWLKNVSNHEDKPQSVSKKVKSEILARYGNNICFHLIVVSR